MIKVSFEAESMDQLRDLVSQFSSADSASEAPASAAPAASRSRKKPETVGSAEAALTQAIAPANPLAAAPVENPMAAAPANPMSQAVAPAANPMASAPAPVVASTGEKPETAKAIAGEKVTLELIRGVISEHQEKKDQIVALYGDYTGKDGGAVSRPLQLKDEDHASFMEDLLSVVNG